MLNLDDQHAWKIRADPLLIEVISFVLNDPVVTIDISALVAHTFKILIWRFGSEAGEVRRKMPVKDRERVACLGVLVKTGR